MEPKTKKWKKIQKMTMDMLRSICEQSRESVESVLKKKATDGRICGKGRFKAWSEE